MKRADTPPFPSPLAFWMTSWTSLALTGHLWVGLGFKAAALPGPATVPAPHLEDHTGLRTCLLPWQRRRRLGQTERRVFKGCFSKYLRHPPTDPPVPAPALQPGGGVVRCLQKDVESSRLASGRWRPRPGKKSGPGSPPSLPARVKGSGSEAQPTGAGTREPEPGEKGEAGLGICQRCPCPPPKSPRGGKAGRAPGKREGAPQPGGWRS